MIDLINYNYNKGYCLHLSDENNWWVTGYEDGIKYANTFANVMNLKECSENGSPRLIFLESKEPRIAETKKNNIVSSELFQNFDAEWKFFDIDLIRLWSHVNFDGIICEVMYQENDKTDKYLFLWLSLHAIHQRSIRTGGLPFHAGLVEFMGRGFLLAGQGGVGKSTSCRRLPSNWKPLCDDESLIVLDKSNVYHGHPFPTWSEYIQERSQKTWEVQHSVPLSAIFFLEQSEKDEVIPLSKEQSVILMTNSSKQVYDRSWRWIIKNNQTIIMKNIFNNAFEMAKVIPAYRLRVSLNGRFWEEIEKVIL
jgi:SynChlorMet cassette protein ScmC